MAYFTLAQRIDGRWTPQFGDYDRDCVESELTDFFENGVRRKDLRIIKSGGTQVAIDAAIAELNLKTEGITNGQQ
jgi:hypothetical protein